jgi:hypothetical protein
MNRVEQHLQKMNSENRNIPNKSYDQIIFEETMAVSPEMTQLRNWYEDTETQELLQLYYDEVATHTLKEKAPKTHFWEKLKKTKTIQIKPSLESVLDYRESIIAKHVTQYKDVGTYRPLETQGEDIQLEVAVTFPDHDYLVEDYWESSKLVPQISYITIKFKYTTQLNTYDILFNQVYFIRGGGYTIEVSFSTSPKNPIVFKTLEEFKDYLAKKIASKRKAK